MIRCKEKGCSKQSTFGIKGEGPTFCAEHRKKGMIRKSNAKCSSKDCKDLAIWGQNWIPSHCDIHKTDDDENLVEHPCSSCNLIYILDKYKKCKNCNPESWKTAKLAKQNALMDYLDAYNLKGSRTDTEVDGESVEKRDLTVYMTLVTRL